MSVDIGLTVQYCTITFNSTIMNEEKKSISKKQTFNLFSRLNLSCSVSSISFIYYNCRHLLHICRHDAILSLLGENVEKCLELKCIPRRIVLEKYISKTFYFTIN